MTSLSELNNKKIAILGFGQEGVSTANYLQRHGFKYSILDSNPALELDQNTQAGLVDLVTGPDYLANLENYDVIFRSPGIRATLPEIQNAKEKGKTITSQTKLFFDLCPAQIIGVTGTKGKGTTSSLIFEVLKKAGKKNSVGWEYWGTCVRFFGHSR